MNLGKHAKPDHHLDLHHGMAGRSAMEKRTTSNRKPSIPTSAQPRPAPEAAYSTANTTHRHRCKAQWCLEGGSTDTTSPPVT